MRSTTRIALMEATGLAGELVALLQPACERIEIAGSIRRQRPDVGDVELVVVPRLKAPLGLFGEPAGPRSNGAPA